MAEHSPASRMITRRAGVWLLALAAATLAACAPSTGATAAPSTVTVTVAPAPVATPIAQQVNASGPFQSPSGNIRCTMYTSTDGLGNARCEAVHHDWVAAAPANCQLNWGDRVDLEQGSPAEVGCYGQELPAPTHTLEYGQLQTIGSIRCDSQPTGITCLDTNTWHFFSVSRETLQLG
jgi:hypothetical protein